MEPCLLRVRKVHQKPWDNGLIEWYVENVMVDWSFDL